MSTETPSAEPVAWGIGRADGTIKGDEISGLHRDTVLAVERLNESKVSPGKPYTVVPLYRTPPETAAAGDGSIWDGRKGAVEVHIVARNEDGTPHEPSSDTLKAIAELLRPPSSSSPALPVSTGDAKLIEELRLYVARHEQYPEDDDMFELTVADATSLLALARAGATSFYHVESEEKIRALALGDAPHEDTRRLDWVMQEKHGCSPNRKDGWDAWGSELSQATYTGSTFREAIDRASSGTPAQQEKA